MAPPESDLPKNQRDACMRKSSVIGEVGSQRRFGIMFRRLCSLVILPCVSVDYKV
jgi:hypothetical protein